MDMYPLLKNNSDLTREQEVLLLHFGATVF